MNATKIITAFVATTAIALTASYAEARPKKQVVDANSSPAYAAMYGPGDSRYSPSGTPGSYDQPPATGRRQVVSTIVSGDIRIVGGVTPACRYVYTLSCGCQTAEYFGVKNTNLNLASNWGRLEQYSGPQVGAAAWRSGHVMAIIGGGPGAWKIRDANTHVNGRRHVTAEYTKESLSGYRFANPHSEYNGGRIRSVSHHRKARLASR